MSGVYCPVGTLQALADKQALSERQWRQWAVAVPALLLACSCIVFKATDGNDLEGEAKGGLVTPALTDLGLAWVTSCNSIAVPT